MALQDILTAIVQLSDERISKARSAHQRDVSEMREENERKIAKKKQEIAVSKEEKKKQMLTKAQTHASMIKRNAELAAKQRLLDELYDGVVDKLCSLPKDKTEALLKSCLSDLDDQGVIRPAKSHEDLLKALISGTDLTMGDPVDAKGGFVFMSEKEDRDFTFEHLVHTYLRPKTEVDSAHTLFA